jgi:hypothetical protein
MHTVGPYEEVTADLAPTRLVESGELVAFDIAPLDLGLPELANGAPKAISRPGISPRLSHPGRSASPVASRSSGGASTWCPFRRSGRPRTKNEADSSGDLTDMKSRSRAAAKVSGTPASTTKCSVMTTS